MHFSFLLSFLTFLLLLFLYFPSSSSSSSHVVIFMCMQCQCGVCILYRPVCTFTKCDEDDCVSHNMMLTSCSAIWHVKEYPVYTDWNIVFFPPKVVVINFTPTKKNHKRLVLLSVAFVLLMRVILLFFFSFCKIACLVPHVI